MAVFWTMASLLTAAVLLFVIPPLLRTREPDDGPTRAALNVALLREKLAELDAEFRAGHLDAEGYAAARRELERRVLEDVARETAAAPAPAGTAAAWAAGLGTALLIPGLALSGYAWLGTPSALRPPSAAAANPHAIGPEQISAMAARLAKRLESAPDDAEGWAMLARSLNALGQHAQAANAYAQLARLQPRDAGVIADQADALAMANGRRLDGEPYAIVRRALALDPSHPKALALAGSAEFERRNFAEAVRFWERALLILPPDAPMARSLRASVEQARSASAATPVAARP